MCVFPCYLVIISVILSHKLSQNLLLRCGDGELHILCLEFKISCISNMCEILALISNHDMMLG